MLDIKMIVENPEAVRQGMAKRNKEVDVDALLALDKTRRELLGAVEALKARQNQVSKMIPQYKKEGRDVNALFAENEELSDKVWRTTRRSKRWRKN
jgi:seryl-tRNA synthetase